MRTIVINNVIYKITEKEYKHIIKMRNEAIEQSKQGLRQCFFATNKLEEYLDKAKKKYKQFAKVDFISITDDILI